MSKLDWFTILIVAVCAFAIGLLIYNATGMLKDDDDVVEQLDNQRLEDNYRELEEDEIEEDRIADAAEAERNASRAGEGEKKTTPATPGADNRTDESYVDEGRDGTRTTAVRTEPTTNVSPTATRLHASSGKYMVLVGSYRVRDSAREMQETLVRKGFDQAEVRLFDNGTYARVLVNRFASLSDANALKRQLKNAGITDVIVQVKR